MLNDHMQIASWLQPEDFLLDVDVVNGRQLLDLVATYVARTQRLEQGPIFRALWRREQAGSTGLGLGFAIPHARIGGISRPLTFFVRTRTAIDFDAPDGEPVSQLLVILAPLDGSKDHHLHLLALVAQLFAERDFRARLDLAADAPQAAETFRTGLTHLDATDRTGRP